MRQVQQESLATQDSTSIHQRNMNLLDHRLQRQFCMTLHNLLQPNSILLTSATTRWSWNSGLFNTATACRAGLCANTSRFWF